MHRAIAFAALVLAAGPALARIGRAAAVTPAATVLRIDDPHLFERLDQVSPISIHRIVGDRLDGVPAAETATHDTIASFEAPTILAGPDRAWVASFSAVLSRCVWVRSHAAVAALAHPEIAVRFGPDTCAVDLLLDRQEARLALVAADGAGAESTPVDSVATRIRLLLDEVLREVSSRKANEAGPCDDPVVPEASSAQGAYQPPVAKTTVQPTYPQEAQEDRIQGRVDLRVLVGRDGAPCRIERIAGPPVLAAAAERAVLQWTFVPGQMNGDTVAAWLEVPVGFHIDDRRRPAVRATSP
ncbi:MAG TPA: energy transducer TonB [Candidatus Eisenbacteria bacterium]